jgi:molybdate transport system substrate-binding protein
MRTRVTMLAAGVLALATLVQPGQAAEITILGGMGNVTGIRALGAVFESATNHKVIATQEANVMTKIDANAPADIVTGGPMLIDNLIKSGKVISGRVDWARAGIGVAIKKGAPKPDLSNTDAFVRMLRNAKSIGYSSVGSGQMAHNIIKSLGLEEELKARTKRLDGFPAAEAVARGEVEIAMQQINVILPVEGAELAGPLPRELQMYNPFSAGVLAVSKEVETAYLMLNFMASPQNEVFLRRVGMVPPEAPPEL